MILSLRQIEEIGAATIRDFNEFFFHDSTRPQRRGMNTTYLFKEETTNGQKKLRIGTAQEFAKVAEQNRTLPIEKRRYFIKEKSLDPDSPDYLFIEVSREPYLCNRQHFVRSGKHFS